MSELTILEYPDTFLRRTTLPVKNIDGALQEFIDRMAATMYNAKGAGLAAIQVGLDRRLLIYDLTQQEGEPQLEVLINPVITLCEGTQVFEQEGCLSVPDFRANVKRANRVQVKAVDRHGNPLTIEAEGFQAVVLQHEIDHLEGKLFIDHISALKRGMYKRSIKKRLKQKE